jgi:hypothetical protein
MVFRRLLQPLLPAAGRFPFSQDPLLLYFWFLLSGGKKKKFRPTWGLTLSVWRTQESGQFYGSVQTRVI